MTRDSSVIVFLTFASFASFARTPIRAEESTRAKLAKDAKLKAIKHDEIAPVVVESVYEVLLAEEGR